MKQEYTKSVKYPKDPKEYILWRRNQAVNYFKRGETMSHVAARFGLSLKWVEKTLRLWMIEHE